MFRVNDPLLKKAKKAGFVARSVYKLEEIDRRYHIFKKGNKVLDLGCSPGSWLQYSALKVKNSGRVVGVDISPLSEKLMPLPTWASFIQKDVFSIKPEELKHEFGCFDVVLSDLSPKTTGIPSTDSERSFELALYALKFTCSVLKKRGIFVCKIFQGSTHNEFISETEKKFQKVKLLRAVGTRKHSREIYVIGKEKNCERTKF